MSNIEKVGNFTFGSGRISADQSGTFVLYLWNGNRFLFDVGEISALDKILERIQNKTSKSTYENPEVFWRTNGTKIMEVYFTNAYYARYTNFDHLMIQLGLKKTFSENSVCIREGGTVYGIFRLSEIPELRKYLRILTEGSPYHRAVQLIDTVEEQRVERVIRIDRFPLNNRNSRTPLKLEKEFRQETIKTMNIEASFGIGVDYYIKANLEAKFGLAREQKITESVRISMEAEPGEHKEYVINWKETITVGYAVFDINSARERIPFMLKSGLTPDIHQEIIE